MQMPLLTSLLLYHRLLLNSTFLCNITYPASFSNFASSEIGISIKYYLLFYSGCFFLFLWSVLRAFPALAGKIPAAGNLFETDLLETFLSYRT